ncbi:MAG TPA: hypothetical protein PLZ05_03050 [Alphaproteobacteria bacterium]|nr:hypothetical protein [Alphaproteobacteria bacterium]
MPKHVKPCKKLNPECCARGCLKQDKETQEKRETALFNYENHGGVMPVQCCKEPKVYVYRAMLDEPVNSKRINVQQNGVKEWSETAQQNRNNFIRLTLESCYKTY